MQGIQMDASTKVRNFFEAFPIRTFTSGEILLRPGAHDRVFYIQEGVVQQYDIAANGEKLVVNIYKPGAFLLLPSILADLESEFFFEATEPVVVRIAPQNVVRDFLRNDADVLYDTLTRLSRGSDGILRRVARIMEGGAEARVLQELETLRARFPSDTGAVKVTITQLAEQTGLARETVSRALKKMRDNGAIRASHGSFTICD